jgi:hypothetical protein
MINFELLEDEAKSHFFLPSTSSTDLISQMKPLKAEA